MNKYSNFEIYDVVNNIKTLKNMDEEEIQNEIITAFAGYTCDDIDYVILSSPSQMNGFEADEESTHLAYVDHPDAPIINFTLSKNKALWDVKDAWVEGVIQVQRNVIFSKAGGNAGKNSINYKVNLNKDIINALDITEESKTIEFIIEDDRVWVRKI